MGEEEIQKETRRGGPCAAGECGGEAEGRHRGSQQGIGVGFCSRGSHRDGVQTRRAPFPTTSTEMQQAGGYRADLKPRGCPTHRKQHLQAAPHRPPIQTHLLLSTPLPQHPSCLTPGHGRAIRAQHCENSTSHTQTSPVKRFDPTCAVQNTARPPVLHAGQMKASALLGLCSSKQSTSACQALSLSLILHQPHTAQVLLWRHGCHHSPTQPFCPSSTHPPPPLQAGIVCHAKHGGPKESEGAREKCKDNFRHPVHQEEQGSCIFSGRS